MLSPPVPLLERGKFPKITPPSDAQLFSLSLPLPQAAVQPFGVGRKTPGQSAMPVPLSSGLTASLIAPHICCLPQLGPAPSVAWMPLLCAHPLAGGQRLEDASSSRLIGLGRPPVLWCLQSLPLLAISREQGDTGPCCQT